VGISKGAKGGDPPRAKELSEMYSNQAMIENAGKWLTERADKSANREHRMEMVEWAVLVFVIASVVIDFYSIFFGTSHSVTSSSNKG
jgi:hypothetical protein